MALAKHMQKQMHYSAVKPVRICGSFEPNSTSAVSSTYFRGAGFIAARTGVGTYTVTLSELPRRVIAYGADVSDSAFDGTVPAECEIISYVSTTGVLTLQVGKWNGSAWVATDLSQDTTNHYTKIAFWLETDESSAPLR
jgi:hypothetical protein